MFTMKGMIQCLKSTKNFWVVLALKNTKTRRKVVFRNGCTAQLNLSEYKIIIGPLSSGYFVESLGSLWSFSKGKIKIIGPLQYMSVLNEDFDKNCIVDCSNRIVLDVGGFLGDTAVHFSARGATRVIIYEPVEAYHEFIRLNVALNGVNAELHDEGIGETDGCITVRYDRLGYDFGLRNSGANEMTIKTRSVRRVIDESGADIAQFDCEGAERSLLRVPSEVLRKIGFYIIETHSLEIKKALKSAFESAGFVLVKDIPNAGYRGYEKLSTVYFRRI